MTSHQTTVPWPAKATDVPQPTTLLPKLPSSSLSHNSSLLTPDSLGTTPVDHHVTKRPGRVTDNTSVTDNTIVDTAIDAKLLMSNLDDPSDDHHSALSSSTGNNHIDQFELRFKDAKAERKRLHLFALQQQTLLENMRTELKIVNERWEVEKHKRQPPNLNPPDVIHTGSKTSPRHQHNPSPSTGSRTSSHHQNAPPTDFRLAHLDIKNVQDHHGLWFRTNDLVWKPGAKVHYASTSPPRSNDDEALTLSMNPVYIVG